MGKIYPPGKVKLIAGLISNDEALFDKIEVILEKRLKNKIDFRSGIIDFTYTDYYDKEMGRDLKRRFLSFKKLVRLERIAKTKLETNNIEKRFCVDGKRAVNIDPGYIDMAKLVLLSTKDYSHRVHAGNGIFAEVTLHYKDKRFNFWPWTYPDYKSEEYIRIFGAIRDMYKDAKGA
ncbi:MAG: DUF4416 family protein [Candidatus Omnitrophota bacterium]|nr:DUF4416 family protein [Candidatus Omnitrophota bacterium]